MNASGWENIHFVQPSDLQRVWGEILKDFGEEALRLLLCIQVKMLHGSSAIWVWSSEEKFGLNI